MVEITDADRHALAIHWFRGAKAKYGFIPGWMLKEMQSICDGECDDDYTLEAFATHRIQSTAARQSELDAAKAEVERLRADNEALQKRVAELEAIYESAGKVYKYHMENKCEWSDALEDVLSPLWVLLVQRENMKEPTQ